MGMEGSEPVGRAGALADAAEERLTGEWRRKPDAALQYYRIPADLGELAKGVRHIVQRMAWAPVAGRAARVGDSGRRYTWRPALGGVHSAREYASETRMLTRAGGRRCRMATDA